MTFHRERYPSNWPEVRASIVERAGNACECTGQCGECLARCAAPNHARICRRIDTPSSWEPAEAIGDRFPPEDFRPALRVVLTVAHVDHVESNNDPSNLLALCQRCHLKMDARDNASRRRDNRFDAAGQGTLPGIGDR